MKTRALRGLIGITVAGIAVVGMTACKRSQHRPQRAHVIAPHPAQADTAAYAWLALVDSGKADQSLAAASSAFRSHTQPAQWTQALAKIRTPLGAVQKRTMTAAQPMAMVQGGPKGDFVGMRFTTDFANKTGAVETIAVVHDTDGKWHVAQYSIR
jgi:Protein of unknown function (DUF4019)